MSPSSIFCAPLAEFHGRVPDPKQGMFRKSTECTYINMDHIDHIPHTSKASIVYLVFFKLGSDVLTITFNADIPDIQLICLNVNMTNND